MKTIGNDEARTYRCKMLQDDRRALHDIPNIASQHELSAYGAAHLDVARREGIALATLDRHLSAALTKAGGRCVRP